MNLIHSLLLLAPSSVYAGLNNRFSFDTQLSQNEIADSLSSFQVKVIETSQSNRRARATEGYQLIDDGYDKQTIYMGYYDPPCNPLNQQKYNLTFATDMLVAESVVTLWDYTDKVKLFYKNGTKGHIRATTLYEVLGCIPCGHSYHTIFKDMAENGFNRYPFGYNGMKGVRLELDGVVRWIQEGNFERRTMFSYLDACPGEDPKHSYESLNDYYEEWEHDQTGTGGEYYQTSTGGEYYQTGTGGEYGQSGTGGEYDQTGTAGAGTAGEYDQTGTDEAYDQIGTGGEYEQKGTGETIEDGSNEVKNSEYSNHREDPNSDDHLGGKFIYCQNVRHDDIVEAKSIEISYAYSAETTTAEVCEILLQEIEMAMLHYLLRNLCNHEYTNNQQQGYTFIGGSIFQRDVAGDKCETSDYNAIGCTEFKGDMTVYVSQASHGEIVAKDVRESISTGCEDDNIVQEIKNETVKRLNYLGPSTAHVVASVSDSTRLPNSKEKNTLGIALGTVFGLLGLILAALLLAKRKKVVKVTKTTSEEDDTVAECADDKGPYHSEDFDESSFRPPNVKRPSYVHSTQNVHFCTSATCPECKAAGPTSFIFVSNTVEV